MALDIAKLGSRSLRALMRAMQKLTIEQVAPSAEPPVKFTAFFNPEEYTLSKENNFAVQSIPGLSTPLLQYVAGNVRTLEMELFFDTYDSDKAVKEDVRGQTDQVAGLMKINPELHAPPILKVSWGSLDFTCVLTRVSQKFQMFADDGKPVRARLTVSFQEYKTPEDQSREDGKQTADFSKVHRVETGDTLSALAGRYYADPALWRPIALSNALDNPRDLRPGQLLRVPPLPFLDPDTGEELR